MDWLLFGLGFLLTVCWFVGAFLPLCRRPRFVSRAEKVGWVFNILGSIAIIVLIVMVVIKVTRDVSDGSPNSSPSNGYYYGYYG